MRDGYVTELSVSFRVEFVALLYSVFLSVCSNFYLNYIILMTLIHYSEFLIV